MHCRLKLLMPLTLFLTLLVSVAGADEPTIEQARTAMHSAVSFFRNKCGVQGGYVFRVSSDLKNREGEEKVGATTAWIQPPGTPAVGDAYLTAHLWTKDPILLEAARETGKALVRGQLLSGGWTEQIEFAPADRKQYAYRVDGHKTAGKLRNLSTFDDDKSQSCLRFLMRLDQYLQGKDREIHEAVVAAQDGFLAAQYPNGAWPQRYSQPVNPQDFPVVKASYPQTWSREFPKQNYASYYTLNDNTQCDLIDTMLLAHDLTGDRRFLNAAIKGGEFLILAQMPDPQPGWAQQYDVEMHPAWARRFEPPAISGGESQQIMRMLIHLAERTGERRFLDPIPKALAYYRTCVLADGRLARFYELRTNRPLFFTKSYVLTYESDDLPTHYGFLVGNGLDRIQRDYDLALARLASGKNTPGRGDPLPPKMSRSLKEQAAEAVSSLDDRGAWVANGWIESKVFIKNLETLAGYVAAGNPDKQ